MNEPESVTGASRAGESPRSGHSLDGLAGLGASEPNYPRPPAVPDYDLLWRIASGAYGEVWLARSRATGALRAAKIVWRHTFEDDRPFQREFEGIQKFERISREHPGQLALFHIGRNEPEGYFYYVMELADGVEDPKAEVRNPKEGRSPKSEKLPGEGEAGVTDPRCPADSDPRDLEGYVPHTLRADLAHGRLPAERVLEIGLALAEALGHLHRHGLVHRDVKPSNVIFVNGRSKLADIGLVTDASDQCSIVGTEGYLPPEGPGTPQADIFALGKVLYEAATGLDRREFPRLPAESRTWPDAKQLFELNAILVKACATDPDERYASAEKMLSELTMLGRGKSVRRMRMLEAYWSAGKKAALIIGVLALLGGVIAVLLRPSRVSQPSADGPESTNLQAKALCEKAMQILRNDIYERLPEAYAMFNQAITNDPNCARPFIGLLELRLRESVPGLPETAPEELEAITRHLETLGAGLAATYCAESIRSYGQWDYPEAERCALKAIEANANYELAHTWYAHMLTHWGRPAEGREQGKRSRDIKPSKAVVYRVLGHACYAERNFTNAITWYFTALNWETNHLPAYLYIGRALQARGDYTNALDYFKRADVLRGADEAETKRRYEELRRALDSGGIRGYWAQQWEQTKKNPNADFCRKAEIQINLGNTNAALDWLEKACALRKSKRAAADPGLHDLLFDEYWDGLHNNSRFQTLLDQIGYSQVMPPQQK